MQCMSVITFLLLWNTQTVNYRIGIILRWVTVTIKKNTIRNILSLLLYLIQEGLWTVLACMNVIDISAAEISFAVLSIIIYLNRFDISTKIDKINVCLISITLRQFVCVKISVQPDKSTTIIQSVLWYFTSLIRRYTFRRFMTSAVLLRTWQMLLSKWNTAKRKADCLFLCVLWAWDRALRYLQYLSTLSSVQYYIII